MGTKLFKKARYKSERRSLIILFCLTFLIVPYVLAGQLSGDGEMKLEHWLLAIGTIVVLAAISLVVILLMQRQFLGNALHVEKGHFSLIKKYTQEIAQVLQISPPDVYIVMDPYLNAFSLGFKRPYSITLNSALVEDLDHEELTAILVHEMGHIYFGHTRIGAFMSPAGQSVPIMSYLMGFWGRKAELSCDRLALNLTRNPRAVIDALIKVHVGPKFLEQLDAEGVLFQDYRNKGVLARFAQTLADHPFLTTRVKEILKYSQELGLVYVDPHGRTVCINCGLKVPQGTEQCERCHFKLAVHQEVAPLSQVVTGTR